MSDDRSLRPSEIIIIIVFLAFVITDILALLSGVSSVILPSRTLGFWLILLFIPLFGSYVVILAYSVIGYSQQPKFRNLMISMMTLDLLVAGTFYLLTSAASLSWSPFALGERNDTIVDALGLILAPMPLLGSFAKDALVSERERVSVIVYGGIIIPMLLFWFFLSPQPVFVTGPAGGTLVQSSAIGLVLLLVTLATGSSSGLKLALAWRSGRNRVDLAFCLSVVLWMIALLLHRVIQNNPLQATVILFNFTVAGGMLLLTVAMTIAAVIEPHMDLRFLVDERTRQLDKSRQESEYYLNIWSHKVGNLLQGVVTYLELIEIYLAEKKQEALLTSAMSLAKEMELINRQVSVLARLKGEKELVTRARDIVELTTSAIASAESFLGTDSFVMDNTDRLREEWILGSDLAEQAIVNLLVYLVTDSRGRPIHVIVDLSTSENSVDLAFSCEGTQLSRDVRESLFEKLDPAKTTLSLALFSVKILMELHGGEILYSFIPETSQNRFVLRFRAVAGGLRPS